MWKHIKPAPYNTFVLLTAFDSLSTTFESTAVHVLFVLLKVLTTFVSVTIFASPIFLGATEFRSSFFKKVHDGSIVMATRSSAFTTSNERTYICIARPCECTIDKTPILIHTAVLLATTIDTRMILGSRL